MKPVLRNELKIGNYYVAYAKNTATTNTKRKLLFMFQMGQFSDSVDAPIFAYSMTYETRPSEYESERYSREVKVEKRPMVLGKNFSYLELTDEEFLLHSVAENI